MRFSWVVFFSILGHCSSAQLDTNLLFFQEFAEVKIDSITRFDEWILSTTHYPNGQKRDEVRIFVAEDCQNGNKCNIKYQHQVYYDDKLSTIALKEGKYLIVSQYKNTYHHYAWWYNNIGKEFRRISEKSSKKR